MVSAGVSWNGKTEIFFIDPQKTKINQKTYIDFLKTSLLPECRRLYPDNDFVFMQDSAPSHRAKASQNFLRENTPDFISSQEWTTQSPDLNPLDYSVWDVLQELVYEGRVTRQSQKLYCSGKGVQKLWQSRMEDLFSTFSADQLTDTNYSDVLCSLRTTNNINDELLANIVLWRAILFRLYHG